MKKRFCRDNFYQYLRILFTLGFLIFLTGLSFPSERDYYRLGLDFMKEGNALEASACFLRSLSEDKAISDYPLYGLFLISKEKGNITTSRKIAEIFKKKHIDSRWYEEILFYLAQMHSVRKEYDESVKLFSEYLRISRQGNKRIDALLKLADVFYKSGRKSEAKKYYLIIWEDYPHTSAADVAEEILKKQFYAVEEIRDKFLVTSLHKRAQKLHSSYSYSREVSELDYIIRRQGDRLTGFLIEVIVEKGKALESLKEYSNAVQLYIDSSSRIKKSTFKSQYPFFLYRQAYCYLQLSDNDKFISVSKEITGNYKDSSYAPRTFYLLYFFYKNRKDFKNAKDSLDNIINSGGSYFSKSDILWKSGYLSYEDGDFPSAINYFKKSAEISEDDKEQYRKSLFWAGKSAEKMKLYPYANTLFKKGESRDSFYGWMSHYRITGRNNTLDKMFEDVCDAPLFDDSEKFIETTLEALNKKLNNRKFDVYFRRGIQLNNIGLKDDSLYEIKEAVKQLKGINKNDVKTISIMLSSIGGYKDAIIYLRNNYVESLNLLLPSDDISKIVYPLAYYENIFSECRQFSINPFFTMALIRQESYFDPKALSIAGAVGLMQIMPSTAGRLTGKSIDRETLFSPLVNISIGVKYLSLLMKANENNPTFVLSAYNAGEKKAAEWQEKNIHSDSEEFIENITYSETREYVKKVMRNYFYYIDIYCGGN